MTSDLGALSAPRFLVDAEKAARRIAGKQVKRVEKEVAGAAGGIEHAQVAWILRSALLETLLGLHQVVEVGELRIGATHLAPGSTKRVVS